MRLWWLLLITISLASGDLQSYNVYDPDYEAIAFRNSEDNNYQSGIQTNVNYNLEVDFASKKRSNMEEEQGKRQQRFHSWGGKRYEKQGTKKGKQGKGGGYDVEQSNHEPDNEEESYFSPENLSLNILNFVNDDSLMIPLNKRAKQPAFSSWGGKRNLKVIKQDEKRSNYDSVFQPGVFKIRITEQNRKRYPAFNSWAGKRNAAFNSWRGKRVPAFNSWAEKRNAAFNSWGGKRVPSFNSWGGKRGAAFNSWGGKRDAAFNSWGGKRDAAFNSWGGKRDASFNSWGRKEDAAFNSRGEKRTAAFNSWGGERAAAFNSWGGKRATAFNSWGGKKRATVFNNRGDKIGWGEKSGFQIGDMEGKEALDIHEEKRIFETNCILFQSRCREICLSFKNLKNERSLYNSGFDPGDLMLLIENKCQACHCSWNEKEINKQLIYHLLGEKTFQDFNNLERKKKVFTKIKKIILNLLFSKIDKNMPPLTGKKRFDEIDEDMKQTTNPGFNHFFQSANPNNNNFQIRFFEPAAKMNDSKVEEESKLNEQHQRQYSVRGTPKDILKDSSDEIIGTAKKLEGNRAFNFNSNNQKVTDEFQGTDSPQRKKELDNKISTQSFDASMDQNKDIPEEEKYFSTETSIYNDANSDSNNEINEDYINYVTDNSDEIYENKNMKYTSNQPEYHRSSNWNGKRSPIFHSWYKNKVPAIRLSNGKRRPAFSSWGGKRSENPNFQNDSEECTSSNEGKTCINTMENFIIEPIYNLPDEYHKLRQKRNIKLNNQNKSVSDTSYENTLNRDKRSNNNMKNNKDITRLVLQGGFAWPMMVKSFPKGVDFYAWGGKR